MRRKRRVIMARLIRWSEMDDAFDAEFWRRVGAEGRFAAMWQMVKEADLFRGGTRDIPRLDKSRERAIRRGSPR